MSEVLQPVKQKLSHKIARLIGRDIIDNEWREGHFIGREPELLRHYKISRDTFREALRVLEWQGLARTTRGASGGLVVAKPSQTAIINILRDYFDLTDVTFEEVMEARRRLERLTVRLATIRLTEDAIPALHTLLEELAKPLDNLSEEVMRQLQLIQEIGRISGNSVLALFIAPLDYVAVDFANLSEALQKNVDASRAKSHLIINNLVSAIIDNDEGAATRQLDDYLDIIEKVLRPRNSSDKKIKDIYPQWFDAGHNKSAQNPIYRIKRDIDEMGLGIGDRLGSEAELTKKYTVSRSIFREASRILELIGVTHSRKGRDGGLIVSKADSSNTIEAAAQFLEQSNLPFSQVYEARVALDTFAVELAAQRRTDSHIAALQEALQAEIDAETTGDFVAAASAMLSAIYHACGNRVIGLYIGILLNSKVFRPTHEEHLQKLLDRKTLIVRSHQRIVKAIEDQDSRLASRYIRDHRAQVASYLEM